MIPTVQSKDAPEAARIRRKQERVKVVADADDRVVRQEEHAQERVVRKAKRLRQAHCQM